MTERRKPAGEALWGDRDEVGSQPLWVRNRDVPGVDKDGNTVDSITSTTSGGAFVKGNSNTDNVKEITIASGSEGTGYDTPPVVVFTNPETSRAEATATLTGVLDKVTITDQGNGYDVQSPPTATLSARGTGNDAAVKAVVTGKNVNNATVSVRGYGFTTAPSVTFDAPVTTPGTGATVTARLLPTGPDIGTGFTNGAGIDEIEVTNGGSGYSSNTIARITTPLYAEAAQARVVVVNGEVTKVVVTSAGNGYITAPTVEIEDLTYVGQGATAAVKVVDGKLSLQGEETDSNIGVLMPGDRYDYRYTVGTVAKGSTVTREGKIGVDVYGSKVRGITVLDPGEGYTDTNQLMVTITDAHTATGTVSLTNGINDVTLNNDAMGNVIGGSGYGSVPEVFIPGNAKVTAVISSGAVSDFTVNERGFGYASAPEVRIAEPQFVGAHAIATIDRGSITGVTLTASGRGYRNPYGGDDDNLHDIVPDLNADENPLLHQGLPPLNVDGDYKITLTKPTGPNAKEATLRLFLKRDEKGNLYETGPNAGAFDKIIVADGGAGYTSAPTITFPNPKRRATGDALIENGEVTAVEMTDLGLGYYEIEPSQTVEVRNPNDPTENLNKITPGKYVNVTFTAPGLTAWADGTRYSRGDLRINDSKDYRCIKEHLSDDTANTGNEPGGSGDWELYWEEIKATAEGRVAVRGGFVTGVAITNPGAGYTSAPTVTFDEAGFDSETFTMATGTTSVTENAGKVVGVEVTNPGQGYASVPTVAFGEAWSDKETYNKGDTIRNGTEHYRANIDGLFGTTDEPSGTGDTYKWTHLGAVATGTAVLTTNTERTVYGVDNDEAELIDLELAEIRIINPGTGYTSTATFTVTPATGNTPTTNLGFHHGVSGGGIVITGIADRGAGYTSAPTITVTGGGGSGALVEAIMRPRAVIGNYLKIPGWSSAIVYTDSKGNQRFRVESLVAFGGKDGTGIRHDSDTVGTTIMLPDFFTTQPVNIISVVGNDDAVFTPVVSNPDMLDLDYQWQWQQGGSGGFVDIPGINGVELRFGSDETVGSDYLFRGNNEFRLLLSLRSHTNVSIPEYVSSSTYTKGTVVHVGAANYQALSAVAANVAPSGDTTDTTFWAYLGSAVKMTDKVELEEVVPHINIVNDVDNFDATTTGTNVPGVFRLEVDIPQMVGVTPTFDWETRASGGNWADVALGLNTTETNDLAAGSSTLRVGVADTTQYVDQQEFRCIVSYVFANVFDTTQNPNPYEWGDGESYKTGKLVVVGGFLYRALIDHTSDDDTTSGNQPGTSGSAVGTTWEQIPSQVTSTTGVLTTS